MNYLDRQLQNVKDNYNYFFVKLIFTIFKVIVKLSFMLLISSIFNYTVINIISLIYTIYAMYNVYSIWRYYSNIIDDIKNTLEYDDLSFEIDTRLLSGSLVKDVVKYGK